MSGKEIVRVSDFTKYPGPRFESLGPGSGELFRDTILLPKIQKFGTNIVINLDGVMGYGSSFLEESFGGAIRKGIDPKTLLKILEDVVCRDEPSLKDEITGYVIDEAKKRDLM